MIMWSPNDPTFLLITTINSKQRIKKTATICLLGRVNKYKQTMERVKHEEATTWVWVFRFYPPCLGSIWPWTTAAESHTVWVAQVPTANIFSGHREQGKEHGWAGGEGK